MNRESKTFDSVTEANTFMANNMEISRRRNRYGLTIDGTIGFANFHREGETVTATSSYHAPLTLNHMLNGEEW